MSGQPARRIVVFGARGRIGLRVVREALRRGHTVTAAVRDGTLPAHLSTVPVISADVTEPSDVERAARCHEVAVNAIARTDADPDALIRAAKALLLGLPRAGTERLVVVGGSGSLLTEEGVPFVDSSGFVARRRTSAMAQVDALSLYRSADTSLRWTYVSPPAQLVAGCRTGQYREGLDELLVDDQGRSEITVEDLAVAIVDEIELERHDGRRFTVARA